MTEEAAATNAAGKEGEVEEEHSGIPKAEFIVSLKYVKNYEIIFNFLCF